MCVGYSISGLHLGTFVQVERYTCYVCWVQHFWCAPWYICPGGRGMQAM